MHSTGARAPRAGRGEARRDPGGRRARTRAGRRSVQARLDGIRRRSADVHRTPAGARGERRRWEESRDAAIYLSEARVAITFGSGKSTPRELVEIGLPLDIAMAGLTTNSAELCGRARSLGRIAPGKIADAIVTDGDLLDVRSRVEYVFIDGVQMSLENRQCDLDEKHRDRLQRMRAAQR